MQFTNILFYFLIFSFNYIDFINSPNPSITDNSNNSTKKFSLFSSSSKKSTGSPSSSSILSTTSTNTNSSTSFSLGFGNSSTTNSIVLDFNADQISNDFETSTTIPGILKYSAKSTATGTFNKIKGNGKELSFTKKIDYVLCTSPFDNNITIVFQDDTTEEYFLSEDGFLSSNKQEEDNVEEDNDQDNKIQLSDESKKQEEVIEDENNKINNEIITGIELDLLDPSDDFDYEEIDNIKCYKPINKSNIISKIKIENSLRILESDVKENFVCFLQESSSCSILVVYKGNENKWLKYTLSRSPSTLILMDVTLIRKFDAINPEQLFIDKSTPDDDSEFIYNNLLVNVDHQGMMKSKNKGNKIFILKVTNTKNNTIQDYDIEFEKHFHIIDGFMFYAIRSNNDFSEMIFSYTNDNVLLHEKYIKIDNKYFKDNKTVYKCDLNRTKKFLDININEQKVIYLKSLVADCIEQGFKLLHYGKFKIINIEKNNLSTFLIFPNLEFYLKNNIKHRLILCENGRNISFVMDTETNNKRTKYIIGTDIIKGNPFSIMAKFEPEEGLEDEFLDGEDGFVSSTKQESDKQEEDEENVDQNNKDQLNLESE